MSYPYPQDRHRDRKEKGEHTYKDAKEALTQQEAALEAQVHERGQEPPRPSSLSQGGEDIPEDVLDRMRDADAQLEQVNGTSASG
jgi:hypothetical protein